jgi:conjugal transfer pilus assembly protein TraU
LDEDFIDIDDLEKMQLSGTHADHSNTEDATVFAQVHYLTHPILDLIVAEFDSICVEFSDSKMEYISETDSEWQGIYSSMWWPEADLFANLPMVEACMADAAAAQLGTPIDALYWCMGGWGMLFNMNGHLNQDEYTTGNAGLAARTIAHMGRRGFLMDAASSICHVRPMPVWKKSYFRLQPLRPRERSFKIPIGMNPLVWAGGLNKVGLKGDNFAWLLWRLRICCASI